MAEVKKEFTGSGEVLMQIYDLATELATKAGENHRDVFQLLCRYIDVDQKVKLKKEELEFWTKKIEESKRQIIIQRALFEGKTGKG